VRFALGCGDVSKTQGRGVSGQLEITSSDRAALF
jgi:hypothetical protein